MSKALGDLLDTSKYAEPPEIKQIKAYIKARFQSEVGVAVGPRQITIAVSSAALAGTLRMHLHQLQQLCNTDKRLVIRIS